MTDFGIVEDNDLSHRTLEFFILLFSEDENSESEVKFVINQSGRKQVNAAECSKSCSANTGNTADLIWTAFQEPAI